MSSTGYWPLAISGRVLLVMEEPGCRFFSRLLSSWGLTLIAVSSCEAASHFLASEADVSLVVTDAELPDGDWRTIVSAAREAGAVAEVLVKHSEWELGEERAGAVEQDISSMDLSPELVASELTAQPVPQAS